MRRIERTPIPSQNSALSVAAFAFGLVLTSATQLRSESLGVGAGELVLLAWGVLSCLTMVRHQAFVASPALKAFAAFWTLAFVLLIASLLLTDAASIEENRADILHDLMAFAFVAFILISYVTPPALEARVRRTGIAFLNVCVVSLLLLALISVRIPVIGPMRIWYYNRFTAWAENPNQLALLVSGAPIVGGYLALVHRGRARVWYVALSVLAIAIGIATRSDAVRLSWIVGGGFILAGVWWRAVYVGTRRTAAAALAYIIGPLLIIAVAMGSGAAIEDRITSASRSVYAENNQGSLRMYLWTQGVEAFVRGPILGKGAGPHSQLATGHAMEAHNTLIDLATSLGIFGLVAYLALLGWILRCAWRSRSVLLLAGWLSIFVFSLFHYVMRQPIYWFNLLTIITFAAQRVRSGDHLGVATLGRVRLQTANIVAGPVTTSPSSARAWHA